MLLLSGTDACDRSPPLGSAPPQSTVASAAPPASAAAPKLEGTAASTAPTAAVETGSREPSPTSAFAGSPSPDTRRSETIFGAGGVYAGLPPSWETEDVYNAYLLVFTKEANAYLRMETGDGLDPAKLDKSFTSASAYAIHTKDLEWDTPWMDAKVGPSGYTAKVRRGHGRSIDSRKKARAAIALAVEIPARKPVHILGTWDDPAPAIEKQFADVVRGLGRCIHKPNRGCVPVEPTGEEKELANPPKAIKGPSPFG